MRSFSRTLRTVRYLRAGQVWHRLRRRAGRLLPERALAAPAEIALRDDLPRGLLEASLAGEAAGGSEAAWLEKLERGVFTHLGEEKLLRRDGGPVDWRLGPVAQDRLWTVTLHYHAWAERLAVMAARGDALSERAARLLHTLLTDWLAQCDFGAPGARDLAWNAYAVATRIGHWVRAWHLLEAGGRGGSAGGGGAAEGATDGRGFTGELRERFLGSLWEQAAFLERNLEWDLRANHLLRDAVGLAWAGRFFVGREARRWLATATRLAVQQGAEQVLDDGGHFERSPMYHLHAMDDFATLACLVEDADAAAQLRDTWRAMAEFALWARHGDGGIPLLNDAALNGAEPPDRVLRRGGQLLDVALNVSPRCGPRHFADFGLAVHHDRAWSVFFDVGPVGVDYQPGHAHADTLTFEASYRGRRLIVDPGTFGYDLDDRRAADRSTAAHNTACIDGENSSEVWHIFRVGRRARPRDVRVSAEGGAFHAAAAHDGYGHLPGRPIHRREVALAREGELHVTDQVTGGGEHEVSAGLLIAPEWRVERIDATGWRLTCGELAVTVRIISEEEIACGEERAVYHPSFGSEQATRRLTWRRRGPLPLCVETVIAAGTSDSVEAGRSASRLAV